MAAMSQATESHWHRKWFAKCAKSQIWRGNISSSFVLYGSEHKILSLLSRTIDRQGLEVNYVQIGDKRRIFQSFCAYHVPPRYPPFLVDCCCFPRRHFHRSEAASQRPRNGKDACSSRKRYHVLTWIPLFSILTK